ncbi:MULTISPECIES: hypothetical protein [unclassified Vibrio]|uniref:hypothetical protein n=1 Tax=unclassified Vibrio TaxID=2614977 RepID=UPI000C83810B|nr:MULTISPECIES: hypothetical protein [unclassified Vibrio]PMK74883.1 hypothetical protein BCT92_23850 [Vibrio sp. 10N.261.52.E5]TKF76809.1 hypothetical protein FCV65_24605 [Vibrio sp. F13]
MNDHETVSTNEEALIKINLVHKSLGKDKVSSIEDYVVGRGIDESNARDVLEIRQGLKEMVTFIALIIDKTFLVLFCFSVFYFGSKASKELYVSFKNKRNQKEKRIADLEEQLKEVKLLRK